MKNFLPALTLTVLLCAACDENESTLCNINYQSTYVNGDGNATSGSYTEPTTGLNRQAGASGGQTHESGVGKSAAQRKVNQVNAAAGAQDLAKAEQQWQVDFDKWRSDHANQFKSFVSKKKQTIESPGLIDGGLDESAPEVDPSTFATNFSYPPPQRPVRTTANVENCRQLSVSEAFNGNVFRGIDRLFAGDQSKTQSSLRPSLQPAIDFFIRAAFALSATADGFDVSPTQLAALGKLDPRFENRFGMLKSAHARRAKEFGDRVWQVAVERKNGLKLSFYVDEDPTRSCELLDKTIERKTGSSSWKLSNSRTKKALNSKNPFDGKPCSAEKLSGFYFVNFDGDRRALAPAITMLISKTESNVDYFISNYDLDVGRESQLHANFRAFFGR